MLTNTPYLRTSLFLAMLFTLSAGFYQVVNYQLDHRHHNHHPEDDYGRQAPLNSEALRNGTVELPLFPGCSGGDYASRSRCARANMVRYLNKHLNQDVLDRKGRVNIRFTVDLSGQLQNARLIQKTDPVLAAEVMRLIGRQQGEDIRWTPGKIKGISRAMNATLRVSFGPGCKGCEQVMVEMVP